MERFVGKNIKSGKCGVIVGETVRLDEPYWKVVTWDNNYERRRHTVWKKEFAIAMPDMAVEDILPPEPEPEEMPRFYIKNINTGSVGTTTHCVEADGFEYYPVTRPDGADCRWKRQYCVLIDEEEYREAAASQSEKREPWNKGRVGPTKKPDKHGRRCKRCNKIITNGNRWWCQCCHSYVTGHCPDYRNNQSSPF